MSAVLWVDDTRITELPLGWDALVSHGTESWTWRVLDRRRTYLGHLVGVSGGSLTLNLHAQTRGAGSLTWAGAAADIPDWLSLLLQPVFTLTASDGSWVSWPMGVYMPSTPDEEHGAAEQLTVPVALYDRTLMLRQAKALADFSLPAGTVVTQAATDLVAQTVGGYDQVAIPELPDTLRQARVWEPGTERLTIVNDLLDTIGYGTLWADPTGLLRAEPYLRPGDRPKAWVFAENERGVTGPIVRRRRDYFDAPNVFAGYSTADGETLPLLATSAIPDDHPLSAVSRGTPGYPHEVSRVETGLEVTSQAVLQARVDRLRDEAMNPDVTIDLEHLPLPLWPSVRVDLDLGAITGPAVVETLSIDCEPSAMWRTGMRAVAA